METIILVTFLEKPIRAFKNEKDAVTWIKKMCKNYNTNILDYLIHTILMYE